MKLTEHFSFEELTDSLSHPTLVNTNRKEALPYVKFLTRIAEQLEIIREFYGISIKPNSGFRGPSLNKAVGSKATKSQHLTGQAVDFNITGVSVDSIFDDIKSGKIPITDCSKVIIEKIGGRSWIHFGIADTFGKAITFLKTTDGVHYTQVGV